ncbi:ABC transporter permease (plasmid) [Mesorhizobium sp. ORM8.1]
MLAVRIGLAFISLLVVSVLIFAMTNALPGDFAAAILGRDATPESLAAMRESLGLNQPGYIRYFTWLWGVVRGDFGFSLMSQTGDVRTVAGIVGPRLYNTVILAGITAIIAVPIAVAIGILSAMYRNSAGEKLIGVITMTTIACPEFFIAYLMVLLFAVKLRWFPALSSLHGSSDAVTYARSLTLPIATLAIATIGHIARMTRASLVNLLSQPYIEMAHCKGIVPLKIITRHALPNAWAPISSIIAFDVAYLVVGVVIVEVIFVYPGIGQTMVDAVRNRDYPVVQACTLIFAATYIVVNMLADVVTIATNPRLLYPK